MNTSQPKSPHHIQSTTIKFCVEGDNEIDSRNLQYDVHPGAKFDYILHRTNLIFQLKLIQNQRELARTQMPAVLTRPLENTRLVGYVLTGNRSMLLDTDGSVAWLCHCAKFRSTLRVMEKCYEKVPLLYEN